MYPRHSLLLWFTAPLGTNLFSEWTAFAKNRIVYQSSQTLPPHRALRLKLGFQTTKPLAANTPTSSDQRREEEVYSPSIFIISSSVLCFILTSFMFPSLRFFPLNPFFHVFSLHLPLYDIYFYFLVVSLTPFSSLTLLCFLQHLLRLLLHILINGIPADSKTDR